MIKLTETDGGETIKVTQTTLDQLIADDVVWYDGEKWLYSDCEAFQESLNKK